MILQFKTLNELSSVFPSSFSKIFTGLCHNAFLNVSFPPWHTAHYCSTATDSLRFHIALRLDFWCDLFEKCLFLSISIIFVFLSYHGCFAWNEFMSWWIVSFVVVKFCDTLVCRIGSSLISFVSVWYVGLVLYVFAKILINLLLSQFQQAFIASFSW